MKDWLFPDYASQMHEGYLTSVLLAWINARCVSFCLDRYWGRVEREPSLVEGFTMLTAYCFYLPLGIMGPLVTSKKFKEGTERPLRPLGLQLLADTVVGFARYGLWLTVTDISTFITFQQSFTYYVSTLSTALSVLTLLTLLLSSASHSLPPPPVGPLWDGLRHGPVLPPEVRGDVRHVQPPRQAGRDGGPGPSCLYREGSPLQRHVEILRLRAV